MAAFFAGGPAGLRPHVKHHKSTWLGLRQLEAGATGLTCSTTDELLAFARAGAGDLLLANVVVDRARLAAVAEAARLTRVTVSVDSVDAVTRLAEAADGATLGAVVELDIGQRRHGAESTEEAIGVAAAVRAARRLELRGAMGYEGHLVPVVDRAEREAAAARAYEPLAELARELDAEVVTGGSAATYRAAAALPMTDVQAGSYALLDSTYARLLPEFEPALVRVATAGRIRGDGVLVVDAGSKRLASDHGTPRLLGHVAEHLGFAEEHSRFTLDGAGPRVGERVAIVPGHGCSTVALHPRLHGMRGGRLERTIAVDARDDVAPGQPFGENPRLTST